MKVLFVTFEFQSAVSGGVGRVINGLAPELARSVRLHVLVVFCSFWRRRRCQLHEVSDSGAPREKGPRVLDTPENLVRLVAREGYDVVHFFCVSPIMTRKLEALRTRLPRVKLVFSVHNLLEHEKSVRTTTRRLLRHERRTLELVDHVHVLNHAGLRYLSESYPAVALRKPTSVIANGLGRDGFVARDQAFWRALAPRVRGYRAVISCLSRWAPGKGLELLVPAVEALVRRGEDVCLVLAGRKPRSWEVGSRTYMQKVDALLKALGPRAVVLGWLDEAQRNVLLDLTDVFVMPSELEYFSYASFEPLHEGVPVVQSRLDCLVEYLVDGEHCSFFSPGDVDDLTEKLSALISDSDRARKTAARGQARVRELFRWRPIADEYRSMYETLSTTVRRAHARSLSHSP
jgi:glycosyltransferase involved in cell wall biosynthesis